ncbi:hypothetical protein [Nocardia sp. NPDC057030]|uniref:hypothetical protein n=1 Tax=unclassified Nocardia TaxID=2637762 RepID=UPI00362A0BC9
MRAELVFDEHPSWIGDARIYRLTPPYHGHDHVAVTVHPVEYGQWQSAGVDVVGCDENGCIAGDHVVPIFQSYVVMSHAEVLAVLGYGEGTS